jgi:formylglycine-generating enzyme required for sulfatase activity
MNREKWQERGAAWLAFLAAMVILDKTATFAEEQNGMVLVPAGRAIVGTNDAERRELAKRFDCHPTWLDDDLPRQEVALAAFWIDRYPVTNAQYLAFIQATGHGRPGWWGRWGGVFPAEYADHPVVGVNGQDAVAFARWIGKRLPTAQEWEAAVGGPGHSLFAWGEAWPGPLRLRRQTQVSWVLPGTRPVGSGDCGRSAAGVEDFAGQVLEWVADGILHHDSQFRRLRGASWFHEDPVNFRVASGCCAQERWSTAFSGFRCALEGNQAPPRVPKPKPRPLPSVKTAPNRPKSEVAPGPLVLAAAGGNSRQLSIRLPRFEFEGLSLAAPEDIAWNGSSVVSWRDHPEMTWTERTATRAAYDMRLPPLELHAEFVAGEDSLQQRFTATNRTKQAGAFRTSSCFRLQSLPMFYDCEELRTFALSAGGTFVPVRRLARSDNCTRWRTILSGEELGKDLHWAVLAVVSRDNRRIIATGRAGDGTAFSLGTNSLFTCLHTDSTVAAAPGEKAVSRQFFWFLEGGRDELLRRVRQDLKLEVVKK